MANPLGAHFSRTLKLSGSSSRLEINAAVFNKKTKRWEAPQLSEAEYHAIQGAIETIRSTGKFQELNEAGTQIEITRDKMLMKKNGRWVDLLSKKAVPAKTRKQVQKITSAAIQALGGIHEQETLKEVPEVFRKLSRQGVVIGVKVSSLPEILGARLRQEREYLEWIQSAKDYLVDADWRSYLTDEEFDVDDLISRIDKLEDKTTKMFDHLAKVWEFIENGEIETAQNYYAANIPKTFGQYCDAQREWVVEQNALSNLLGTDFEQNPFLLDKSRPAFHFNIMQEIMSLTETNDAMDIAKDSIEAYLLSYDNFLEVSAITSRTFSFIEEQEREFNDEIDKLTHALSDSEIIAWLLQNHYKIDDIEQYRKSAEKLKAASDKSLEIIGKSLASLNVGLTQQGLAEFAKDMETHAIVYNQALQDLFFHQKLAQGRLSYYDSYFDLDLNRLSLYEKYFQEATFYAEAHGVIDADERDQVDESAWELATQVISTQAGIFENSIATTDFNNLIHEMREKYEMLLEALYDFNQAFETKRSDFEEMMRSYGLSDLETAYLFNSLSHVSDAILDWRMQFQQVIDSMNFGDPHGAIDNFAKIIADHFHSIMAKFSPSSLILARFSEERIVFGMKALLLKNGFEPERIQSIIPNLQRLYLFATDIKSYFNRACRFAKLDRNSLEEAEATLQSNLNDYNNYHFNYSKVYELDNNFLKFLFTDGLKNLPPSFLSDWRKILKQFKLNSKSIGGLIKIHNQLAKEIEVLKKAQTAVENETDKTQKRVLRSQLRKLTEEKIPKIDRLRSQFVKLNGFETFERISTAFEEFLTKHPIENIVDRLNELFEDKPLTFKSPPFKFDTVDEMITKLEDILKRNPQMQDKVAEELSLIRQLQGLLHFDARVQDFAQSFDDKTRFVDTLYTSLSLFYPWRYGTIGDMLLKGPHSDEPRFIDTLKRHGWNKSTITKFSRWYDSYVQAHAPLLLAKKELDEDPENINLQREYIKLKNRQIPRLNALTHQFNASGGKAKIDALNDALTYYKEHIKGFLVENDEDITVSLHMLDQLKGLKDDITARNDWLTEISRQPPLSWQHLHLDFLKDPKVMTLLGKEGVKKKDLDSVIKLYHDYQETLAKFNELDRKLGADPGNVELRNTIKTLFSERYKKFQKLKEKYKALDTKIMRIQSALNKYNISFNLVEAFNQKRDLLTSLNERFSI